MFHEIFGSGEMEIKCLVLFLAFALGYVKAVPSCPDQTTGIEFYPDPEDCSRYYECYSGILSHMNCPAHLYWNTNQDACDYAENVDCGSRPHPTSATTNGTTPSTTSQSTKNTATTPSYDPDPQCPATTENITFYPDPSNCKQYFECNRGERFTIVCPENLLYNVNEEACDYPEHVNCVGRSTPTSTVSTSSVTSPMTTVTPSTSTASTQNTATTPSFDPDPVCPATNENITFYPDPSNCKQYFECNRGERFTIVCPENLLYNVNEEACDYPEHVNCVGRSTPTSTVSTSSVTSPMTTMRPSTSTASTQNTATTPSFDPDPVCPATKENITFYPDPSNCKQYFECNRGERFTIVCPDNLLYNVNEEACDYPEHVSCVGRSTPTSTASTSSITSPMTNATPPTSSASTENTATTPSFDPDPVCPATNENITFYPDPSNCKQYFECNRGERFTLVCPDNLLYNVNEKACDYPEHVNCVGRSTPNPAAASSTNTQAPSTTTSGTTTSYDPNPTCPATSANITFYPDPTNCKQYFECDRGTRFTMVCPGELFWNVNENACDYPEHVDCTGRSTPGTSSTTPGTTRPTSATTNSGATTPINPNPQCPATSANITFFPDPSNCKNYFECNRGIRYTMICPGELMWNTQANACDYPENVDCSGRSTPTGTQTTSTTTTSPLTSPATTSSGTAGTTTSYDPDPVCPDTTANITFYPDPSNCKQYFECNRGERFTMVCPRELLYNVNAKACDYPANVDCSGRSTPSGSDTTVSASTSAGTTAGTTSGTTAASKEHPCKHHSDGAYVGDPSDCTIFYHCKDGSGDAEHCPTGTNWCQQELTCDVPEKTGCSCYTG